MSTRQTKLIIDVKKIKHNIREIQKIIGDKTELMPVIKARGYGTGIGTLPNFFDSLGINIVGVAVADEGIGLKNRKFTKEILILNQPFIEEIDDIIDYGLISSVCSAEYIEKLNEKAKKKCKIAKIHLEIDTGMGRTGIFPNDANKFVNLIKNCNNIELNGVFTHFSSSDSDFEYTKKQIKIFNETVKILQQHFAIKYIHCCNTGGIINFKEAHHNLVRAGIALYGYLPNENLREKINLRPAIVLKSKIVFVHYAQKGDSISYNRSYIAEKPIKVAVVPIGYADGISRNYSGNVLINNKFAKIIGLVNMDSFMADITDIPGAEINSDVYIWDNQKITLEKVAKKNLTINYEILSNISPRVNKEFLL
jgi:alanine racemase